MKISQWLEPEGLAIIERLAGDELTLEGIASAMGISRRTLYRWSERYPDVSKAILRGRDSRRTPAVENALFKRATGYTATDSETSSTFEGTRDEDGDPLDGYGTMRTRTVTREVPPDVPSAIFYLTMRHPDEWQRRPDAPEAGPAPSVVTGSEEA